MPFYIHLVQKIVKWPISVLICLNAMQGLFWQVWNGLIQPEEIFCDPFFWKFKNDI